MLEYLSVEPYTTSTIPVQVLSMVSCLVMSSCLFSTPVMFSTVCSGWWWSLVLFSTCAGGGGDCTVLHMYWMRVTVLFSTCARGGGLYSSAHALGKGNCISKFCPAFGQLFSGVTVQYCTVLVLGRLYCSVLGLRPLCFSPLVLVGWRGFSTCVRGMGGLQEVQCNIYSARNKYSFLTVFRKFPTL